ncbi:putative regulatory protein, FmdB family [Polaromonas sp. OV174]|uniref:FmdB family zinc ribbon protein n=1 Tax=Polaromonas sp. OV174 TaxID=1855300 RepID=UPI0008E4143F|nr:FmdB family zinc ribbon protein [Polaromonas sp. OV174]SFB68080.1 putative regulatory protein, FmdB family [Polaromonas sp. OV174]
MPIYAYKCESCGFAKDVLQKMSDAPLTDCPECATPSFKKQVTAAGFQLKGSGWYVTDFRGGNTGAPAVKPATTEAAGTDSKAADSGAAVAAPAASTPAPAAVAPVSKSSSSEASAKAA